MTLAGSRLTVVVGTSKASGDSTPLAFLGVTQLSGGSPNYTISASPASVSIPQGNQGTSTITTSVSGGFNSAISLSASGVPSGTTVSFNPQSIPAPGSGSSTMTITVGASTAAGTYPITVTGNGGGIQQNTTVTLTVPFSTDAYGGLTMAPATGCNQSGYFQLAKVKGRWVYADPDCNVFYQRAVYDADRLFILQQIMQSRYNNSSAAWANHSLQRMTTWGFNATDIYSSLYMLPVPWGNNPAAAIQVPFILYYPVLKESCTPIKVSACQSR